MSKNIDERRLELGYYTIQVPMETYLSDTDGLGHLNNVAVARMYQDARDRFYYVTIFGEEYSHEKVCGIGVIVQLNISYFREGFCPTPVMVGTTVSQVGKSSYLLHQGLFQNGICLGLCDVTLVYVENGAREVIPDTLRAGLVELMNE